MQFANSQELDLKRINILIQFQIDKKWKKYQNFKPLKYNNLPNQLKITIIITIIMPMLII